MLSRNSNKSVGASPLSLPYRQQPCKVSFKTRMPVPISPFVQKRVFWNGSFQKRRLELNWVAPPDRQESDFVALYRFLEVASSSYKKDESSPSRDDPRWAGPNSYLIRVKAGRPGGKYLFTACSMYLEPNLQDTLSPNIRKSHSNHFGL